MGSKRTSGADGSARGKSTDVTAKKGDTQQGIRGTRTERGSAVKAGRNMGGRTITGDRAR